MFDLVSFDVPARSRETQSLFRVGSSKVVLNEGWGILTQTNSQTTYVFDTANFKGVTSITIGHVGGQKGRITVDNIKLDVGTNWIGQDLVDQEVYWEFLDTGTDAGTAWREPCFDDSGWASGQGKLGYGAPDVGTQIDFGVDPMNKFPTTYFRHEFDVADPGMLQNGIGNVLRDDGVILYLNGTEIYRDNQTGSAFGDFADTAIEGADEGVWLPFEFDTGLLVPGTNVIAAELHQASGADPDLIFDLELAAQVVPEPSTLVLLGMAAVVLLTCAWRKRRGR